MIKDLLKAVLLPIFFLALFFGTGAGVSASGVQIVTTAPAAGKPLEARYTGTEEVTLRWYVAGEEAGEGTSYTPGAADFESMITVTAEDGDGTVLAEDRIFFSTLPVVYIETSVPAESIDRTDYVDASLYIQGNSEYESQYLGKAEIKGRGTSSWHYGKKPYKLKLDKKTDLFGFGKSRHYVLLANYLDPGLIRNTVGYRLSGLLGLTAADTVWVDVVMNGEYVGCYQLCEHIRVGQQLVDIFDWEDYASDVAEWINAEDSGLEDALTEDLSWVTEGKVLYRGETYELSDFEGYVSDIAGGYFLEIADNSKEETVFKTPGGININVNSPEYLGTNETMLSWLREYLASAEEALRSDNGYNSDGVHYTELIDFDSMLNYWLCMEILSNEDASGRSRFAGIDLDGKLVFGPVWDFDIGSGSVRAYYGAKGWNVTGTPTGVFTGQDIWKEFVDDPYFQVKARERYLEIRPVLEELVRDGGIIDSYAEALYEAGTANELLWTDGKELTRSFTGEKGDVAIYKAFLRKRFEWLDRQFATEESTTRSLRTFLSAKTYRRSRRVILSVSGGAQPELSVKAPRGADIEIYVNGLRVEAAEDPDTGAYLIPEEALTEPAGKANVISVIARRGRRTFRNYITVTVGTAEELPLSELISEAFELETESCEHELLPVEGREATEERYGIVSCFYCPKCGRYFEDAEGSRSLAASEVISSTATSSRPGGKPLKIRLLLELAHALIAAVLSGLVLLCRFAVRRIKRRRA